MKTNGVDELPAGETNSQLINRQILTTLLHISSGMLQLIHEAHIWSLVDMHTYQGQ